MTKGRSSLRHSPKAKPTGPRAQERRGLAYLSTPEPDYGKKREWKCRIYYISAGDELLCCDSEPMTRRLAEDLERTLPHKRDWVGENQGRGYSSDAVKVEVIRADYAGSTWRGARLVVLPSQRTEKVDSWEDQELTYPAEGSHVTESRAI